MTATITLAFLHHAAAFVVVAMLAIELVVLKNELTLGAARSLLRIDAAYGIAAMLLIVVGFLRVFYTEKGAAYYFASGTFIAKIVLFAIVGVLSIYPTVTFLRWRSTLSAGQIPTLAPEVRRKLRIRVHIELTLLFVIMLMAAMMARGVGYLG